VDGLRQALFAEPDAGDINRRNTHVEADAKGSQDAGSIPAASTFSYAKRYNAMACDLTGRGLFSRHLKVGPSVACGKSSCRSGRWVIAKPKAKWSSNAGGPR
jgi:hypothetical protein